MRLIGERHLQEPRAERCRVFSHESGLDALYTICRLTLPTKVMEAVMRNVDFVDIEHHQTVRLADDFSFTALDLRGKDVTQYGFVATVDGCTVACMGDIPCHPELYPEIAGVDWLMHEAYCLESQRDTLHPERIGHCTVLEAARIAQCVATNRLLLYHRSDALATADPHAVIREVSSAFSDKGSSPHQGHHVIALAGKGTGRCPSILK